MENQLYQNRTNVKDIKKNKINVTVTTIWSKQSLRCARTDHSKSFLSTSTDLEGSKYGCTFHSLAEFSIFIEEHIHLNREKNTEKNHTNKSKTNKQLTVRTINEMCRKHSSLSLKFIQ